MTGRARKTLAKSGRRGREVWWLARVILVYAGLAPLRSQFGWGAGEFESHLLILVR